MHEYMKACQIFDVVSLPVQEVSWYAEQASAMYSPERQELQDLHSLSEVAVQARDTYCPAPHVEQSAQCIETKEEELVKICKSIN